MDRTLVERAIQGDEDAYAGLMAIAGDRLLAIAYRILRDLHRAEDAVEATLVNAWRDLPTLRDADRFEAWLTRILVRECYLEADRGRRSTPTCGRSRSISPAPRTRRPPSSTGIVWIGDSGAYRPTSERSSALDHYLGWSQPGDRPRPRDSSRGP